MLFGRLSLLLLPLLFEKTCAGPADFSIERVAIGSKPRSGAVAVRDTHLKFRWPVPRHLHDAAIAVGTQSGSVTAVNQTSGIYIFPVSIGTPAEVLNLNFDLASADFWVYSSELPPSQRGSHPYYTPGSSSSSKPDAGETWSDSFADGSSASGNVFYEKVVIGGVTATSQAIECATSVSSSFSTPGSGFVGFGFDNINTGSPKQLQTWIGNVAPTLTAPIFTVYLLKSGFGRFDFGYIRNTSYTGSIAYTSVTSSQGFWEFTATGYSVGSSKYTLSMDTIADFDTTLIYLPTSVVNKYYASVAGAQNSNAAGGFIFPCSSSLPTLGVLIGGAYHTVPAAYLNYAVYSGNMCFGSLQSSSGIGINILGEVFFWSQFVVFDTSTPKIGFAQSSGAK